MHASCAHANKNDNPLVYKFLSELHTRVCFPPAVLGLPKGVLSTLHQAFRINTISLEVLSETSA